MKMRTPLAWFNLTHKRQRLLTALAGVSFAVVLMFIFKGFENALYDSQVQLLKALNGDIIVVNRIKTSMFIPEKFARRRLYQAEAFEGVDAAYPLYTTTADWKNPDTKSIRPLRVLAFNLSDPVLPLPEILAKRSALQMPRTAMVDSKSRSEVGSLAIGTVTEVAKQEVRLVGTFPLGTDFTSGNGNVLMSDQNFVRYFSNLGPDADERNLNTVDIGLLKVAPGADVAVLVQTLTQRLPIDILIYSKEDFVNKELTYWKENTNIGFVFSLLTVMSFLVGVIIVYQILYTDVAEHWAEYATLKAMGYSNFFLLKVVIQQAVFMGLLGFLPGFLISFGLYRVTADATGLLMQMTPPRAFNTLVATVIMCLISGAIAVRKVQSTDPAEVFGT
ncbi:MAG: ABC transporter permease DevC [Timaviella obliquedivisa GSE-PSE-MK23-08B]|jgi:putative ABC transport system permease protein|nr:ABC transporter permease DevC [Timaviella obliquedivisa GSE-PSE-MK23-08B]